MKTGTNTSTYFVFKLSSIQKEIVVDLSSGKFGLDCRIILIPDSIPSNKSVWFALGWKFAVRALLLFTPPCLRSRSIWWLSWTTITNLCGSNWGRRFSRRPSRWSWCRLQPWTLDCVCPCRFYPCFAWLSRDSFKLLRGGDNVDDSVDSTPVCSTVYSATV